jgi:hypothetical protein
MAADLPDDHLWRIENVAALIPEHDVKKCEPYREQVQAVTVQNEALLKNYYSGSDNDDFFYPQ